MSKQQVELAVRHLQAGGVIAYPTEAVWGLGCDPFSQTAVEKILAIKERDPGKGLLLVAASRQQLATLLAGLEQTRLAQLDATWPGPVTWLIPDAQQLYPAWIKGEHASVAVRVSAHPLVQRLCLAFGGPIVSTSANTAGETEIRSRTKLEQEFADKIDFILAGELGGDTAPSQIRDLQSGAVIR